MGLRLRLSLGSHPKALTLKLSFCDRFSEAIDRLKHHEIVVHQSAAQPTVAHRTATCRQLQASLARSPSSPLSTSANPAIVRLYFLKWGLACLSLPPTPSFERATSLGRPVHRPGALPPRGVRPG